MTYSYGMETENKTMTTTSELKAGELVTWAVPMNEGEAKSIYKVLEVDRERCLIEYASTTMGIRPTTRANVADLKRI
jgi:hypothetical protein